MIFMPFSYIYCDDYGYLNEWWCPDEAPIFDFYEMRCMSEAEGGICWQWVG